MVAVLEWQCLWSFLWVFHCALSAGLALPTGDLGEQDMDRCVTSLFPVKVLAQYHTVTGDRHKSEEELVVIFNKKISRNPTFRVLKDKVKLLK